MTPSPELTVAINAARQAEQILSSYFADLASAEIRTKYTNEEFQGVVTKADIEAERAIINEIQKEISHIASDSFAPSTHPFLKNIEEKYMKNLNSKKLCISFIH